MANILDTKRLRQKLLDLAVRGKLVPQDPNDEPASELLARIHSEKLEMVKRGELKPKDVKNDTVIYYASDGLPYEKRADGRGEAKCIAEEIPFALPEGWGIARLYSLAYFQSGHTHPKTDLSISGKLPYVQVADMNLPGNSTSIVKSSNYLIKAKRTEVINIPSIIFPKRGGAIATNKKRRVEDFPIAADLNIMAMTPFEPSTFEYISRWFDSIDLQSLNNGSSVPQINNKDVAPLLLPVPPLAEQRRIVAELDRCLSLVDTVERDGGELEALFRRLRSKVLDLAIRGELTERDPGDEPASELLTCIREEKLAMVARGELKPKDVKNDTVIFTGSDGLRYEKRADGRGEPVCIEDEIPFEIPETWAWARLGSLITLLSGVDLASAQYNDTRLGIPYITGASNFVDGNLLENRWTNQPSRISHRGDLLFTCKGTIGEMAVNEFEEAHIARQIMAITPIENQETQYIEIFLKTMVAQIQSRAKGLIPGIERATLLTALLPVPPLAEQGRIVEKVETIFCQLR